jgi:Tetratricopeptide repeat
MRAFLADLKRTGAGLWQSRGFTLAAVSTLALGIRATSAVDNLVVLYCEQGEYRIAEPLSARAIAIHEDRQGPDHSALATSLSNRACVLRGLNRADETEGAEARAEAIRRQRSRPDVRR